MSYEKLFDTSVTNPSMKEWKAQGKKSMGVICCHVPEEMIHAAEMLPVRVRATGCADASDGETWMTTFSCSYARSCLQYLIDGTYDLDGLIATDGCIQASRIYDNWKHIDGGNKEHYLHQLAAPRLYGDKSIKYYKSELEDIKKGMEEFAGVEITDEKLKDSVALYNETRSLIRDLYALRKEENPVINGTDTLKIILSGTSLPKEEFNESLKEFLADSKNREPITDHKIRVMVIGSAIDDPEYIKVIEDAGALVVTDAQCYGSRYLWEPVEIDDSDVLGSIADSYLSRSVCPRMMDGHEKLHEVVLKMYKEYNVDGIIYPKMHNCECWGGESVYLDKLMEQKEIPMLTVEREEIMANAGQLAIRVEAFIEMINKED